MVTTSWFITATEARNNIIKDINVHGEITALETQVLLAAQRGDYEVTVSDNTLMTESTPAQVYSFTVDSQTSELIIPNHPYKTGDAVIVSASLSLPPPLTANTYYYVIFISSSSVKLAASKNDAINGRPISIVLNQGVSQVTLTGNGSQYLTPPTVSFSNVGETVTAQATAVLQPFGSVYSVSLLTSGSNFTDVPVVNINPVGSGAVLGPVTYKVVTPTVIAGGSGYNVNDLITIIGGTGVSAILQVTAINGGSVTAVSIYNPGNYSALPPLSGAITTSLTGSGARFFLSMGIESIGVQSVGVDYLTPPQITIIGGNNDATAIATLSGGTITSVVVTNPGSGFTGIDPVFLINTGSGAQAIARLTPTTISSLQLQYNGGLTYTATPNVQINAIGGGAQVGQIVLGTISADLVNAGIGYKQGDVLLASGGIATRSTSIEVLTTDVSGRILTYNIIDSGLYTVLPTVNTNSFVGGSGVGASFNLSMGVLSVSIANSGALYTTPPLLVFSGSQYATQAAGYCVISGGALTSIVITDPGSGYVVAPSATITGGGPASATAILTPTSVASITVDNPGSGYVVPPIVTVIGTGAGVQAEAVLDANGGIASINVINGGSGFTSTPQVVVTGNAILTAVLTPTSISSLTLNSSGVWSHVPTVVIDGTATAIALMTPTTIAGVTVTASGSNYTSVPVVSWSIGQGQIGAPVFPIAQVNLGYSLAGIVVTKTGSGYTSVPQVVLSAPAQGGTPATAIAVLGSGTGTFSLFAYESSFDYYKVWQNQTPSSTLLTRPMADQMAAVVTYFTNLGYNIVQQTNTITGNTMQWYISW